jgi:hypothetical protein
VGHAPWGAITDSGVIGAPRPVVAVVMFVGAGKRARA